MRRVELPEDVAALFGRLGEACELDYREIVRDQDAWEAAARWPMFRGLVESADTVVPSQKSTSGNKQP